MFSPRPQYPFNRINQQGQPDKNKTGNFGRIQGFFIQIKSEQKDDRRINILQNTDQREIDQPGSLNKDQQRQPAGDPGADEQQADSGIFQEKAGTVSC